MVNSYAQGGDTTAPQLVSFTFSPSSIDISNSAQSVTFTARVTDDISGVKFVSLTFQSPSGRQFNGSATRISGNALDGVYQGSVTFPQYSQVGTYNAFTVRLTDEVFNERFIFQNELISRGFPTTLQVTGTQDITPPQLPSFTFSPTSIDVSNSSQNITFTARVTDDLSGVRFVTVTFQSPSGTQFNGTATRISGNALDGVYQGTITIPRYSQTGTYNINTVRLTDEVFNERFLSQSDVASQGFPTMFQVTGTQDITPPQLVSFSFNPTSINTSSSSQNVTFTTRITDDVSGVRFVTLTFQAPSGTQFSGTATRISGNALDGVYQGTVNFPQFSQTGTYNVATVRLTDEVFNERFVNQNDLTSQGFPTMLQVSNTPPTAANVIIGGKVMNATGRGVFRAIVTLTDATGNPRFAFTNPFGFYRFNDVAAGNTYVFGVSHKSHNFTPQVLSIVEDYSNLNFIANEDR